MDKSSALEKIKKQIGVNIKKIRIENNLEIKQVCAELEISAAAYGNIERGLTDICISRILQIANYFDVHFSAILPINTFENSNNNYNNINENKLDGFILAIDQLKNEIEFLRVQNNFLLKKHK